MELKLKQLKARQQHKDVRARAVEGRRTRREELRRKILVGAIVLAKVEAGEFEGKTLRSWLNPAIAKAEDRVLFGLDA